MNFEIIDKIDSTSLSKIWNTFNEQEVPEAFKLDRIFKWWNDFKFVDNNKLGFNKIPQIIVGTKNNNIKLVLPLVLTNRKKFKFFRFRYLEFITQSFSFKSMDIIAKDLNASEISELFNFITKNIKYDILNLSYLSNNSILKSFFPNTYYQSGKVLISITESYEDIRKKSYTKNLRHILNKFNRRLRELDHPIISKVITNREEIIQYKEQIFEVSNSKTLNKGMHSIYADTKQGESYFAEIVSSQQPYCAVFLYNSRLVSYNLGYINNNTVYAMDASYNREFSDSQKIGMGILAYDLVVQHFAEKCKTLDMGFGMDDYKFRFSKEIELYHHVWIFSKTLKAKLISNRVKKRIYANDQFINNICKKYSAK